MVSRFISFRCTLFLKSLHFRYMNITSYFHHITVSYALGLPVNLQHLYSQFWFTRVYIFAPYKTIYNSFP